MERVKVRVTMGNAARPVRDGWMVVRHEQTKALRLMPGCREPWGYVLLAWTAGSKKDGRALLAEMTAKEAR